LGRGTYKQATPNGVSAEQLSWRHQFTLNIASADVCNAKAQKPRSFAAVVLPEAHPAGPTHVHAYWRRGPLPAKLQP